MVPKQPTYHEQIDAKRIEQIREMLRSLPQACSDFMASIAMTTGTFTRMAYTIDLRTFFDFLHRERVAFADQPLTHITDQQIGSITKNDLVAYTDYLTYYFKEQDDSQDAVVRPLKPLTNREQAIKRKLCSIRSFYDYMYQSQRIAANVTLLLELPKIHEKPIIRLTKEEMTRMLEKSATGEGLTEHQKAYQKQTASRDFAMLSLFLGTGIRVSECVGINIEDVNLEDNAFLVTRKGGNQVVLYMPPEVATALADYMEVRSKIRAVPGHENALFLSMQKRRITQRAVQNLVKKYAALAAPLKPKISPHKLRSTFATNLYNETGDIYLVADTLGHSSVDTTRKHYADVTEERRKMAAERIILPTLEDFAARREAMTSTESKTEKNKKSEA